MMSKLEDSKRDSGENLNPTTPSVYKAGIIGCGFIGIKAEDSHLKAYNECERTNLVAASDNITQWVPIPEFYFNYKVMVREETLDIVSVCTPVETHCQIVCDIAPYVRAIYCEKPMAVTLQECDAMINTCEQFGTILQINHQRRFVKPLFRFGRDIIDTGTHVFDWLNQYGIDADVEYVDTNEHIFELVITRERMILEGVKWLVGILDGKNKEISTGYDGKLALQKALEFRDGLHDSKKRDS
jgi:hypothetical protein